MIASSANRRATTEPGSRREPAGAVSGHPLLTPDGRTITVDYAAMRELQKAGLLTGRRTRLRPGIWAALTRGLLSDRLRRHLGPDLSGPEVCTCECHLCHGEAR